MTVIMGFDARAKHQDPLVWKFTGHRADGFENFIKDYLPRAYGCVKVRLTCRPRNPETPGLDWLLTLREEPLHPGPLRHQLFCWQNMSPTIYVWFWTIVSDLLGVIFVGLGLFVLSLIVWSICVGLGADPDLGVVGLATIGVMALSLLPRRFVWLYRKFSEMRHLPWAYVEPSAHECVDSP